MRRRMSTVVAVSLAALVAGLVVGTPARPAAAQSPERPGGRDHPQPVTGNFVGDGAEELFVYWPGTTGPDVLLTFAKDAAGAVSTTAHRFPVNGHYRPVAGDYDGDGHDELLWYGAGAAPDHVWAFTSTTSVSSRPIAVNGVYTPLAGDFAGDGADDIVWYGAGAGADHLWAHAPGGARTDVALSVGGYYQPVVGSFGADATDDIFWYSYVAADDDHLWDFRAGSGAGAHTSRPIAVNSHYWPVALDMRGEGAGGGDIVWYGFGGDPDYLWDFAGGTRRNGTENVGGQYHPIVTGDLFGDGADDVLWFTDEYPNLARTINVWDHTVDGGTLVRGHYRLDRGSWIPATATAGAG